MREKYNLEEILKEIEQDETVTQKGDRKLTQEEIRKRLQAKKEAMGAKKGQA